MATESQTETDRKAGTEMQIVGPTGRQREGEGQTKLHTSIML